VEERVSEEEGGNERTVSCSWCAAVDCPRRTVATILERACASMVTQHATQSCSETDRPRAENVWFFKLKAVFWGNYREMVPRKGYLTWGTSETKMACFCSS
jgi:hypothetical protein